ncbi:MAG: type III secretion system export apparatus subunit SctT [Pseudomonadota bacterium]
MGFTELIEVVTVFTLALPRMFAVFALVPVFSQSMLPGSARNAVAISFCLMIFPIYGPAFELGSVSTAMFLALIVKEVIIGLLLGMGASLIFHAIQAMGFVIDNQRGSTMASSVDPMTGAQTSPLGIFMTQVIATYFFVSGAVFLFLLILYESYVVFPIASFFPTLELTDTRFFLAILDKIFSLAIVLAAPALIAMFLSEFALGLISRFAPQLNVFFLAMPVKSAVGILLLVLYIVMLAEVWEREFAILPDHLTLLQNIFQ